MSAIDSISNSNRITNNSQEEEMKILKNIEQLQTMEKDLYKELENNTNIATSADSIINRINQLSQIRISLYKSLNYNYKSLQTNVNESRSQLVDLSIVVGIVEEELNNAKTQLNQLNQIKNNKMRMVEINTYYGKEYKAQSGLMKLIIFVFIILLILIILWKKGLLPDSIAKILLGVVLAIGGFFIIRRILDISWRDNMNFDSYNWDFTPDGENTNEYHKETNNNNNNNNPNQFNGIDCIGNACCTEGMKYDINARKCIKNVAPETFVSGQLTKHCFNSKGSKDSKALSGDDYPAPYGSEELITFASV
jgi:uncharacterized membrane protein (DUF485 family)